YGTGGLAFGALKAQLPGGLSESNTSAGWTIGAGAEFALNQNWSAKVEYLYVDLSDKNFLMTGMSNGYQFSTVRVGVNYRF
ncbi:MAG: outer membrane immunogenic protein, partial [Afipia broomeae]